MLIVERLSEGVCGYHVGRIFFKTFSGLCFGFAGVCVCVHVFSFKNNLDLNDHDHNN